jgi:zinc protease
MMCIKHFFYIFAFLFFGLITNSINATPTTILPISYWTTQNGIPVYFVAKSQLPIIDIAIVFKAGSAYDHASPGIAYLTMQLMDQGTSSLSADQIASQFESVGAQYNTSITQDALAFHLRALSQSTLFNPAFNTFANLFSDANFPQDAILRIKKQTLITLEQEKQNPSAIAYKSFYQTLYGNHPYGSPLLGSPQSIEQITRDQLLNFFQHYYVANNAMIAIVGDLSQSTAVKLADLLASKLAMGEKAPPLPVPTASATNFIVKNSYPSQQTTILLGQMGIALKDPEYFPLIVGNQILGGGALTSRLFSEVRNRRGLCYGISSRFSTLEVGGPFMIILQTRKEQATTALNITRQIIKKFVDQGPTDAELRAAKQALIGSLPFMIANNAAILSTLEKIGFYKLPLNYLDTYAIQLESVTAKQVHEAFQKHIKSDKLDIVTVGSTS